MQLAPPSESTAPDLLPSLPRSEDTPESLVTAAVGWSGDGNVESEG